MLGSFEQERSIRLEQRANDGKGAKEAFMACLERSSPSVQARAQDALITAANLEYHHEGISSRAYLAHTMRVASLVIQLWDPEDGLALRVALLHNVLELSNLDQQALNRLAGAEEARIIGLLTVDRPRQKDPEYVRTYYQGLVQAGPAARVVKCLDKLDNLFIIGLNPDQNVRTRYLAEIEQYVVPMVEHDMAHLVRYFEELVEDSRRIGSLTGA